MVMNNKVLAIGAVLTATLMAGVFATTTPLAFADESETNTEQGLAQSNVGSGASTNFNCAENDIDGESFIDAQLCGQADLSGLFD
jgi:hypothetical protein